MFSDITTNFLKVIEIYEGRDDRLIYRSATFGQDSQDSIKISDVKELRSVKKMSIKYSRNEEIPADKDVQKITFYLDQKKVLVVNRVELMCDSRLK